MKATLRCELIGEDMRERLRWMGSFMRDAFGEEFGREFMGGTPPSCWCARITGADRRYGLRREFLQGRRDSQFSNSMGSRGVFMFYILESGHYYEVKRRISWKRSERFFCVVTDQGDIEEVEREEVEAWARSAASV